MNNKLTPEQFIIINPEMHDFEKTSLKIFTGGFKDNEEQLEKEINNFLSNLGKIIYSTQQHDDLNNSIINLLLTLIWVLELFNDESKTKEDIKEVIINRLKQYGVYQIVTTDEKSEVNKDRMVVMSVIFDENNTKDTIKSIKPGWAVSLNNVEYVLKPEEVEIHTSTELVCENIK
jgi:hypothetical protein